MALADARAIEARREPHPPEVHSLFSSPIVREGKDFGEAVASPLLLRLGVMSTEQPQTADECGSIGHGPLTRPEATLSHWERHGSFEKAPWVRGRQLNKFDRSLNFFATK